jgi:hypothetical protein
MKMSQTIPSEILPRFWGTMASVLLGCIVLAARLRRPAASSRQASSTNTSMTSPRPFGSACGPKGLGNLAQAAVAALWRVLV